MDLWLKGLANYFTLELQSSGILSQTPAPSNHTRESGPDALDLQAENPKDGANCS
jgi:hypothetical protein